jgi:hypothetical protein
VRTIAIFLVASSLTALPMCGCSSEDGAPNTAQNGLDAGDGGGGGSCAFDYTNYQSQSAPLTLKADILPIIARSCALSISCHRSGSNYPPNLGPGVGDGAVVATDAVLADVSMSLGMPSIEVPDWLRVKKGDPERSYLMRKLDGSERCGDLACLVVIGSPKPCGERMPGGDSALPLEAEEVRRMRDWIKQGAN